MEQIGTYRDQTLRKMVKRFSTLCVGNKATKTLYFQTLRSLELLLPGLILEFWFIGSVQSFSAIRLLVTPWTAKCQASLSLTNSRSLLKFMSIKSVMPSTHLILCHALLFLPSIIPSISVPSNEFALFIR